MPISVPKLFYRLLLLAGILFYISWLAVFGVEHWNDIGVYSITVVLICFGLVGSLLYDEIEKADKADDKEGESK
ncbi:MAG: hypothetical protein JSV49_10860 [Thermoplasmata archaeon]|nr:MAG: hypothetical protein JSV49_10860 [Thermoplasmata archaeon]